MEYFSKKLSFEIFLFSRPPSSKIKYGSMEEYLSEEKEMIFDKRTYNV